jgi:hypothetical protein
MARGERDGRERDREPKNDSDSDKGPPNGKTEIPGKDAHKGPEEFRKRVLKGLGGSSDPLLREAVKRYAEGLLKRSEEALPCSRPSRSRRSAPWPPAIRRSTTPSPKRSPSSRSSSSCPPSAT